MIVEEFKTDFPEFAHLEGDELWNKMEDIVLKNAQPATEEDMEKFFAHPKSHDGLPLESYRMLFIDTTDYNVKKMKQKVKELRIQIDGLAQLTKQLFTKFRVEMEDLPKEISIEETLKEMEKAPIQFMEKENISHTQFSKPNRELQKATDSLFLAKAWLGKVLGALGEDSPYPKDGTRKTVEDIESTADQVKESDHGDCIYPFILPVDEWKGKNHIKKVDWLRQEISKIVTEVKSLYSDLDDSKTLQHKVYDPWFVSSLLDSTKHLSEARFWLGFELERVRETSKDEIK